MFDVEVKVNIGGVEVHTTNNRGMTPEEIASSAVNKIISISDDASPLIKMQAEAFRERVFHVIVTSINQGVKATERLCIIYFQIKAIETWLKY